MRGWVATSRRELVRLPAVGRLRPMRRLGPACGAVTRAVRRGGGGGDFDGNEAALQARASACRRTDLEVRVGSELVVDITAHVLLVPAVH